jgi:hypothetical protein
LNLIRWKWKWISNYWFLGKSEVKLIFIWFLHQKFVARIFEQVKIMKLECIQKKSFKHPLMLKTFYLPFTSNLKFLSHEWIHLNCNPLHVWIAPVSLYILELHAYSKCTWRALKCLLSYHFHHEWHHSDIENEKISTFQQTLLSSRW